MNRMADWKTVAVIGVLMILGGSLWQLITGESEAMMTGSLLLVAGNLGMLSKDKTQN